MNRDYPPDFMICKSCGAGMIKMDNGWICSDPHCEDGSIIEDNTVSHPSHYNSGKYEVIDVIEDWGLNFNLGNAVKYISRSDHKGKKDEDINKAIWYLQRELGLNKKD